MDQESWHLDKRVPLALIAAIAGQTIIVVWFSASLYSRVGYLEDRVNNYAPQSERIIRLETKMENIQEGITEIKTLIRSRAVAPPIGHP